MELHFYDWIIYFILIGGWSIAYPTSDREAQGGWFILAGIFTFIWIVIFGVLDYNVVDVVNSIKVVQ